MATSQRGQQEAFYELTKASKDKAKNEMFANIKIIMGKIGRFSKTGSMKLIKLVG